MSYPTKLTLIKYSRIVLHERNDLEKPTSEPPGASYVLHRVDRLSVDKYSNRQKAVLIVQGVSKESNYDTLYIEEEIL